MPFISFSCVIAVDSPVLYWIKVVRMSILVLFWSWRKSFYFNYWIWCQLWICHIWPSLLLRFVPSVPTLLRVCIITGCWVFVRGITSIEIIMVFVFHFLEWCIIDWFADVESSLIPWNKCHLILVFDHFNISLDSVGFSILLTIFGPMIIKNVSLLYFLLWCLVWIA